MTVGIPLLHSVEAAAERLSISRTKLYELIGAGSIGTVRIDARTLVPESECVAFVDRLIAEQIGQAPQAGAGLLMAGQPNLVAIRHARLAPPKRSPHRRGRLTPGHILDADPRGRTVCGAEPGAYDLSNRQAHTKSGRQWLTCPACLEATEES